MLYTICCDIRSRDERFDDQKDKYGHRHEENRKSTRHKQIPASEFDFDPTKNTCICPQGKALTFNGIREDSEENQTAYFTGRLLGCRVCLIKVQCMTNPESVDHRKGSGRQVSFRVYSAIPTYTDWMTKPSGTVWSASPEGEYQDDTSQARIDSDEGKRIYSHRMSTVEPVFANLEHNKGLKRFSLRDKKKVQAQWQMFSLVHNIEKLMPYVGR
ncbi:transposase [Oceanobacter mangrovi]|uniref:transposase n=1 Tax=Oceanobacter mangrovi TaxID=2862510 RepID=UPI001C8D8198|nr:transposase [Oceanobacter mangrovi]